MATYHLLILLGIAAFAAAEATEFPKEWAKWKSDYLKVYGSTAEEQHRYSIWLKNKAFVESHNARAEEHGFTVALNKFADLDSKEFAEQYKGYKKPLNGPKIPSKIFEPTPGLELPTSVDWRPRGVVTPVKDQARCGSCWAFSTTGVLEGQHALKTGRLVSLSEQNLVDCSSLNDGCDGGLTSTAYDYIIKNGGIDTEESYPYEGRDGSCRFSSQTVGATVNDSKMISASEVALQQATATVGPISVCIDASKHSFQLYENGVYYEPECSPINLDHCVLVVGYGVSSDGKDYWLVKNSWGPDWGGLGGYIWMSRNMGNNCGIVTDASYPIV